MEPGLGESLSLQANSDQETAPEIDDQTLTNLVVQNIDSIIYATHLDQATRTQLISDYVKVRYAEFTRTEQVQAIDEAIDKQRLILDLTSPNDDDLASELDTLGVLLELKYKRIGGEQNLHEAIENAQEAVRLTPPNHPRLAGRLNNLGNKLQSRYERTRQMDDLDMAIEKAEEAVKTTPPDHPNLAERLNNLGTKLARRYEGKGQMADLKMAIEKAEEAVKTTPPDHPSLACLLSNLGNELEIRHERTGQMTDLDMAIEKAEEAVKTTPPDHPDLAGRLNNLGNKLARRYERTRQMDDLDMAIEKAEEAVKTTPPDHPNLAERLNNLGTKLARRYQGKGQMDDLKMAIEKAEEAVKTTPPDHLNLAGMLSNLGNELEIRYERTRQMTDLDMAIEKAEEAVKTTAPDNPDLAGKLNNLGRMQLLTSDTERTNNALASYLRSWNCYSGIPSHRLRSAIAAVDLLIGQKLWDEATDLAIDAVNLLPLMNKRALSRDDQQNILSVFTGLAATACSLCLESGRPIEGSVEILEQGRGAILGLMIDDRRDVSHLRQLCPDDAKEYEQLRTEVNAIPSDSRTTASEGSEETWKRRARAIQELEDCIDRIRHYPGLQRFLMAVPAHELQQQACAGPIVMVNVTNVRSDAIIIKPDQIQSIALPQFSAQTLQSWKRQNLTQFTIGTYWEKNKNYCDFLFWIWESCVKPIFDSLNLTTSANAMPDLRVWWIGAGEASDIPFHAAGNHYPGSSDNTISHIVSSYTPTIKALDFARERLAQCRRMTAVIVANTAPNRLCVATMPHTPGKSNLPHVARELSGIQRAMASTFALMNLSSPTAAAVKAQLQTCHIFHYAGHGIADPFDPSQGCLVLQKLDNSGIKLVPDLLSVDEVSRLHLQHAQLAYLSACSTAENSTSTLADEVIHLVSGFQVAGFPHAIGSLWLSVDEVCADVAYYFYRTICEEGQNVLVDGSAARALHAGVTEVRKQCLMEPLAWAPYVHFGG